MTPGSEPRHATHETSEEMLGLDKAEERLAQEIVEEQNLHQTDRADNDEEPYPSMSEQVSEQLGGVRGLIESSVPVLAFVLLNVLLGDSVAGLEKRTALYWAIGGAVGTAVLIGVYRLIRKEPVRHAVNGIFGIAIGAFLAYRTGEAKNFYLPGILITLARSGCS